MERIDFLRGSEGWNGDRVGVWGTIAGGRKM